MSEVKCYKVFFRHFDEENVFSWAVSVCWMALYRDLVCEENFEKISKIMGKNWNHHYKNCEEELILVKLNLWSLSLTKDRSSRPEVFYKKGVLRNFTKLTGKQLCQSLRPATLSKKRLWHKCFPVNFVKFLNTFFTRTLLVAASVKTEFSKSI